MEYPGRASVGPIVTQRRSPGWLHFRRFLAHPIRLAAVTSSSGILSRLVAEQVRPVDDGVVLELNKMQYTESEETELHLYQEFCPITPMVASRLNPRQFCDFITDQSQPIHVPRIVFSELRLNGLSSDPERGDAHDLPYHNLQHLRDCLSQIESSHKETKLVAKQATEGVLYRMVKGGFYVGDHAEFAYYPYPSIDELETRCRSWWRSAQIASRPWI